jgi:hypothetical protein
MEKLAIILIASTGVSLFNADFNSASLETFNVSPASTVTDGNVNVDNTSATDTTTDVILFI